MANVLRPRWTTRGRVRRRPAPTAPARRPGEQGGLVLAGDDQVRHRFAERRGRVAADAGVQTVQTDGKLRPPVAHRGCEHDGHAHRRVHRHGEGDPLGPVHEGPVEGLDGDVERPDVVAGGPQGRGGDATCTG